MGRDSIFMLESLRVTLFVSTALGFLSGLGIGGGSLLILWLTMVLNMPQETARSINLLFFLPAAVIACIFRVRQGSLSLRKVFPAILAGTLAAAAASFLGVITHPDILKKPFGILLLLTAVRELFYRPKSESPHRFRKPR